jgi:Tfp pilus assembly protein PilX
MLTQLRPRARAGQAVVAVVLMMSVLLVAVPAAIEIQGISNIDTTQVGNQHTVAGQTAQSALDDYLSRLTADSTYATSYCSHSISTGCHTDPANPAFANRFDHHCSTSSATHTGWVTATGSLTDQNSQYQYVVDTTLLSDNIVHLFINARLGASGNYSCVSLKAAIDTATSPPTVIASRPQPVSSTSW